MKKHISDKQFFIIFSLIIILAAGLRFYDLGLKPMHHDEGNNWYHYIDKIIHGKSFEWSVFNHGTTPFYFDSIPLFFLNPSVANIRIMCALFGVLSIALLIFLRKQLGDLGVLLAASFLAVSPTMIAYSRLFSLPYPYVWFFALIIIIAAVKYHETNQNYWLYVAAAFSGLMITSHELSIIYFAAAFAFLLLYYLWNDQFSDDTKNFWHKIDKKALVLAVVIFFFVILMMMTQFFTTTSTLSKFSDLNYYSSRTFNETGHNKPVFYYVSALGPIEAFAFVLTGFSVFFLKRRLFQQFLFFLVAAIVLFLSILPYKIAWMFTIALLPMYVLAGITAANILERLEHKKIYLVAFLIALIFIFGATTFSALRYNFLAPNEKGSPLNYAGPVDDNYRMISDFDELFEKSRFQNSSILITAKDQYPLSYYLRSSQIEYLEGDNIDLSQFYDEYDIFITEKNNKFDSTVLKKVGEYELRENGYINVLVKR